MHYFINILEGIKKELESIENVKWIVRYFKSPGGEEDCANFFGSQGTTYRNLYLHQNYRL